jgi:hypothetical protein
MTAAADFPTLNSLVSAKIGRDLDSLAAPRAGEFRLDSAVHYYVRGGRGSALVPDPRGYLVTLERFASSRTPSERAKLSVKLCNLNHSSGFLDTVGEAALAEYYRARGELQGVEVPLGITAKDVDVLALIDGTQFWIDVLSVVGSGPEFVDTPAPEDRDWSHATADELSEALPDGSSLMMTPDLVAERLMTSVQKKYKDKFAAAAVGPRAGDRLVVGLCLLHREERLPFVRNMPAPSSTYFQQMPGLASVMIFTLRRTGVSDMLLPVPLAQWDAAPAGILLLAG